MKKFFWILFKILVILFAIAGFGFLAAYAAVYFHWTNTKGIVDEQSDFFWKGGKLTAAVIGYDNNVPADIFFNKQNYCLLKAVKNEYPGEFSRILDLAFNNQKSLAQKNLDALVLVLTGNADQIFNASVVSCSNSNNIQNISIQDFKVLADKVDYKNPFIWATSDEWDFFKAGVLKDKAILEKIQKDTGINSRILVSQLMAEQMRLYYSDRPWFKNAISPLKVLGSMTMFSWGVLGIKEETAQDIEYYLKTPSADFYPGKDFENMLDFQTDNVKQERFDRITDSSNHYYAYLYGALYNKEIISQWQKAGLDISERPEILATLFNIGFVHSKPNENPQVGGSVLKIGNSNYSFGRLAFEFYYSGELLDDFPQSASADKSTEIDINVAQDNNNDKSVENSVAAMSAASLIKPSDVKTITDNVGSYLQNNLNWSDWITVLLPVIK